MGRPNKYDEPLKSYGVKISPMHVFALKLIARTGNTSAEATVLEGVIESLAERLPISRNWRDIWDSNPAIAWLNAYALPEFKPLQRETLRVEFIRQHLAFFYSDKAGKIPNAPRATTLWEHVDELAAEWVKTRRTDYWAAAKKMAAILKKAKLEAPQFGSGASAD
jgi:exonuclease III